MSRAKYSSQSLLLVEAFDLDIHIAVDRARRLHSTFDSINQVAKHATALRSNEEFGCPLPERFNDAVGIVRLTAEDVIRLFMRHNPLMRSSVSLYHRHRFPAEIIGHCVWLYFRFALSFRDVEEMLAMRGVAVSYETIREWCLKFGQTCANGLRHKSPRPGDRWHLDEVFLKINGRLHYLWRAVDQDGDVLDILVQSKRDKGAAKKFFRKLLKGLRYVPRTIITDKLRSYSAAKAEMLPTVEHCQGKWQNNRAENSHQPTRLRERVMRRFKSAGHAQRFLTAFGIITSHFRVGRHQYRARGYRQVMKSRFVAWHEVVCVEAIVN